MVKLKSFALKSLLTTLSVAYLAGDACAQPEGVISRKVEANACDNRQVGDDKNTAENRALDKAGLAAVKLSGIIQQNYPELKTDALDIVAYRIIDEYLFNSKHEVTLSDGERVCVKMSADMEITPDELYVLVREYKDSDSPQADVEAIAEKVNSETTFKPQNLNEKKLLYIEKMIFWNGESTTHYRDFLAGLFSHSEYFYVTDNRDIADYIVRPKLLKADVYEVDKTHHKMEMQIELEASTRLVSDLDEINERQNHFILFAADRDEQEISDNLLRKLLTKASEQASKKIDKYIASKLEKDKVHGK